MNTYFTSDLHFGHYRIIEYCSRPFADVWTMNQEMLRLWNETVAPDDEVYCLGDFCMSPKYLWYVPQLNGTKHLIVGNHDKPFKELVIKKAPGKQYDAYLEAGFASISAELLMPLGGQVVLLNHFPYQNPNAVDQRYFEHRPKDQGRWLLHGHSHSPPDKIIHNKSLDIGVDGNYFRPWSMDEILAIINPKEVA